MGGFLFVGLWLDLDKELEMKNHLIISLLILSVGVSQQIIHTNTYDNGNISSISYHNKTSNGIEKIRYEAYYENGQKKQEGDYKDGKGYGLWTWWDENGQKEREGTYKDGKGYGLWTSWYENGQKYERNLNDGKRDGLTTEWYSNGTKKYEGKYKDGKEVGKWTHYYGDGTIKEVKEY